MSSWHEEVVAAHSPKPKPEKPKKKKPKWDPDKFPCHAQLRCQERNGIFLPKEELKIMAQLIELGKGVHVGGLHYLLRYGRHIFHVIYCSKIKRIKTIYPQDKVAGLMIGTVPREELRKLIEIR